MLNGLFWSKPTFLQIKVYHGIDSAERCLFLDINRHRILFKNITTFSLSMALNTLHRQERHDTQGGGARAPVRGIAQLGAHPGRDRHGEGTRRAGAS